MAKKQSSLKQHVPHLAIIAVVAIVVIVAVVVLVMNKEALVGEASKFYVPKTAIKAPAVYVPKTLVKAPSAIYTTPVCLSNFTNWGAEGMPVTPGNKVTVDIDNQGWISQSYKRGNDLLKKDGVVIGKYVGMAGQGKAIFEVLKVYTDTCNHQYHIDESGCTATGPDIMNATNSGVQYNSNDCGYLVSGGDYSKYETILCSNGACK